MMINITEILLIISTVLLYWKMKMVMKSEFTIIRIKKFLMKITLNIRPLMR